MLLRAIASLATGVIVLAVIAVPVGRSRWQDRTDALFARLEAARTDADPRTFSPLELDGLPAPVQRYLRAALQEGQAVVRAMRAEHVGTFNMSETGEQWKPFTSVQRTMTKRPGFVWDARISMGPGLAVHVHDAYIAGEGILQARLLGLITLADVPASRELARGELMRYFAETAWYPTALLPSQGVRWEPIDDRSARGTMSDGDIFLTLTFMFRGDGLLAGVWADARARTSGGTSVPTPWEGRWLGYERRNGMVVPTEGEVAWLLPEGRHAYWRGRLTRLEYDFVE